MMARGFFGELPEVPVVEVSAGFQPLPARLLQSQVCNAWSERVFQSHVVQLAQVLGWLVYHTHDSRRSAPGFPDLVLVHVGQGRVLWRELKSARGRLSVPQREWLDSLEAAGEDAGVWRPEDWVSGVVEAELKGELL